MTNLFGRLMKFHRGNRTAGEVAEALEVSPRTIHYVEEGRLPTMTTFAKMVKLYDAGETAMTDAQRVDLLRAVVAVGGEK